MRPSQEIDGDPSHLTFMTLSKEVLMAQVISPEPVADSGVGGGGGSYKLCHDQ